MTNLLVLHTMKPFIGGGLHMKRASKISVVVLTLAVILLFGVTAGGGIKALLSGASQLTET